MDRQCTADIQAGGSAAHRKYARAKYMMSSVTAMPAKRMIQSCVLRRSMSRSTDVEMPSVDAMSSSRRCVDCRARMRAAADMREWGQLLHTDTNEERGETARSVTLSMLLCSRKLASALAPIAR